MNKYATMLKDQWTQADPEMVASLEDPETYFSQLGEQAAEQVADLSLNLAGPDKPGEEYLEKVGRLNMARRQAEEIVLAELQPPSYLDADEPEEPEDFESRSPEEQEAWIREAYKHDPEGMEVQLRMLRDMHRYLEVMAPPASDVEEMDEGEMGEDEIL